MFNSNYCSILHRFQIPDFEEYYDVEIRVTGQSGHKNCYHLIA